MKKFIKNIVLYLLLFLVSTFVLDGIYTLIYSNSIVRNKVQFVINASPKHYDAIILGSSRAENHIVTELFEKKGLKVYNLGMSGDGLCDDSILLKLFFEKGNTTKKILFQVDLQFISETSAPAIQATFLPYFTTNQTIYNHYKENAENAFALAYLPFYRYCAFDSRIGLRELLLTLINKKGKFYDQNGFIPLEEKLNSKLKYNLPARVAKKNKYYDEIVNLCKKNQVQLISFMAPFCPYVYNGNYFSKLKKQVPELYDYSGVIKKDSVFAACGHLNKKGATVFTAMLLEKHFGIQPCQSSKL